MIIFTCNKYYILNNILNRYFGKLLRAMVWDSRASIDALHWEKLGKNIYTDAENESREMNLSQ